MLHYLCIIIVPLFFYCMGRFNKYQKKKNKLRWISTIPGWPILGNSLEFGDTTQVINDLHRLIKKYGKLLYLQIGTGQNILASDYDFVEFILGKHEVLDKSTDYRFLLRWLGTGLLTSSGLKWKVRRKMITPAFHFSILEKFIAVFERNLEVLISKLENEIERNSTNIYEFINLYALDVICETAMGVRINAQKDKKSDYVKNVKEMCRISTERAFSAIKGVDLLYYLCSDFYKELNTVKALHSVTNYVIDTRRNELQTANIIKLNDLKYNTENTNKMTFLDILLESTNDGVPLSKEEIREEVDTFMFEGHDTISSATSFTLYLISKHSEVQKRIVEEQRNIFGNNISRYSTYGDLQHMKYLEKVIKEALRLYPPVPIFARSTNKDINYKGNVIPQGVNIAIMSYSIMRDPDNFHDPEKFDPERFEQDNGTKPYAFIPFSAGPRNCIGQKFAMLEIKCIVSKILRCFELAPAVPDHKMILISEAVLKSRNGIRLRIRKRC